MCGIAGFFGYKKIIKGVINKTLISMKNRGPDFCNYFQHSYENNLSIYLLHSRLSIIDLKKRSNQPFILDKYIIVFNGEIYNFIDLKKKLINKGIILKTNSDTEILLHYYKLYGENCVDYFDGMWSFAIFNTDTKKLFLSRDPFGEKPLYFYRDKCGIFFASETKFIKNLSGKNFQINDKKINQYLSFGARALNKDNSTFFKEIYSIKNSENFLINRELKIKKKTYWKLKPKSKKFQIKDIYDNSQFLLMQSLERRLIADVPMAFLLSGGIDSGGLASLAVKKYNKKIDTFSVVDSDVKYNEIDNIRKVVKDLKCNNTVIKISKKNFLQKLADQIKYNHGPVFTLAQYLHSELMKKISLTGTKVVISGVGADEIYSGYYDHYLMHLAILKKKKNYNSELYYWKNYVSKNIRNPIFKDPDLFVNNPNFREHIYDNSKKLSIYLNIPEKFNFKEVSYSKELLTNRRANELFHETVPAILNNEDLNAMKYSIENRSPFLNRDLCEFIFSIEPDKLIKNGYSKFILRKNLEGILNEKIRLNRQKKGFNCSIETLIDLKNAKIQNFLLDDKSNIFHFVNRKKFLNFLNGNFNDNYKSKFLFSFISTKIFLDNNT